MRKQSPFIDVVVRRFARARQRLNPRPPESRPLLSTRGKAVRALPAISQSTSPAIVSTPQRREEVLPYESWPQEDCANEPSLLHCFGEQRALWTLGAKALLLLLSLILSLPLHAAVREVGPIGLTVGDLDQEMHFFTEVLPFEKVSESSSAAGDADRLLGLTNTRLRVVELKLNDEHITLSEHVTNKGRPLPPDSRSFDHWFQHIAMVVRDMDNAYEHLLRAKVKHVSTAPQILPAWNKEAGGIKAFYFRDPEDHVLEIIWFPLDKGDPKWHQPTDKLFLGIDHTAVVVSDTDQSLAFYRDLLGMRVAGHAENYGTEQEHLNQVFGARLRITALRGERGPGIEFLEYISPPGGRPLPKDSKANDLLFWVTALAIDNFDAVTTKLEAQKTQFVSSQVDSLPKASSQRMHSVIVRDPDGHAVRVFDTARPAAERADLRGNP